MRRSLDHCVASPARIMRIAVGIATADRQDLLERALERLRLQTRVPDAIVVCSPSPERNDSAGEWGQRLRWITSARGLTRQRNAILRELSDFDIVVFFDDDFVACPHYLQAVEDAFRDCPDIVVATGRTVKDGILGPGISDEEADRILARRGFHDDRESQVSDVFNAYGCNMAVRLDVVRANGLSFDERLPLYAWLEDVDFCRRAAPYGRIAKIGAAQGVHLGVKAGRQPGRKLGYSQISNPIYLARKGTYPWPRALKQMGRNVLANAIRAFRPEPYVDRLGRVLGNGRALLDLISGRLAPERMTQL